MVPLQTHNLPVTDIPQLLSPMADHLLLLLLSFIITQD
jgi:hypothetical protein